MIKWLKNRLKKALGINELEEKVDILSSERAALEEKVITFSKARALIKEANNQTDLSQELIRQMESFDIKLTKNYSDSAIAAVDAVRIVEQYNLKRFIPPVKEAQTSRVISMEEFQKHPEKYLHKLSKGFLEFPIGLNFDEINRFLRERFMFAHIETQSAYSKSNYGTFELVLEHLLNNSKISKENQETSLVLKKALELSDLQTKKIDSWIYISLLDFLANYEGLTRFILDRSAISNDSKKSAIQAFELVRFSYLTALEIVGKTRIKESSELLDYKSETSKTYYPETNSKEIVLSTEQSTEYNNFQEMKAKIKDSLLSQPKGTSFYEIETLLPLGSKETFRTLASERTLEILSKDKERKGLTNELGKKIEDYTIGESVVLACYFARNIIQNYESLDDGTKRVLSGGAQDKMSGKCTDYTGLALHYLREYLIPLNPEKFNDWFFGFESDGIGNYHHCYMKVVHINPDKTADVYFLDPTRLANQGINALKTPKDIVEAAKTSNLPLLIERTAEEMVYKNESENEKSENEQSENKKSKE